MRQDRRGHRHQIRRAGATLDQVQVALDATIRPEPGLRGQKIVVQLVDHRPPAQHRSIALDRIQQVADYPIAHDRRVAILAAVAGEGGRVGRGVVAVVTCIDGSVPAPEDQHVRPLDRRQVDGGYAISNGIVEAVDVVGRDLDPIIVEFTPRSELDVVLGEQVPVDAQAHGVANARVDRAIDKHSQGLSHDSGII